METIMFWPISSIGGTQKNQGSTKKCSSGYIHKRIRNRKKRITEYADKDEVKDYGRNIFII